MNHVFVFDILLLHLPHAGRCVSFHQHSLNPMLQAELQNLFLTFPRFLRGHFQKNFDAFRYRKHWYL